jgi:hypothetical protein
MPSRVRDGVPVVWVSLFNKTTLVWVCAWRDLVDLEGRTVRVCYAGHLTELIGGEVKVQTIRFQVYCCDRQQFLTFTRERVL